jgi:NitT/TauT family transport system substrate-binding protein
MPFKSVLGYWPHSLPWRILIVALVWLTLISSLHYWFNVTREDSRVIRLGYMPVITNLAAPLLDQATKGAKSTRFEAIKFSSFSEMGEALRNEKIQAAFIIAPLSIVLRQQGEDIKIVYIGNRHESTLVTRKDLNISSLQDLAGKTLAIPIRYSGHNLSILQLLEKEGLTGQIKIVEMNPPDMSTSLATGSLDAYYVGEPFAARALKGGHAKLLNYVEDVWPNFICNLVIVKQKFIERDPDAVKMLVQGAARSGLWAQANMKQAADIASKYWNQPIDLVEYAMNTPNNRIRYNQFVPKQDEMQQIADLMLHFGLIKKNDISGLVEDKFAKATNVEGISDFASILKPFDIR